MRRAQFEIMGLAIVMVLVAVGLFFMLSLSINEESQPDPLTQFTTEQLAQNALDAVLKSSVPGCITRTHAEAIAWNYHGRHTPSNPQGACIDIAEAEPVETGDTDEDLTPQFDFVDQSIRQMMSLDGMRVDYELQIRKSCDDLFGQGCQKALYRNDPSCIAGRSTTTRAGRQVIPLRPYMNEPVEVILWICES